MARARQGLGLDYPREVLSERELAHASEVAVELGRLAIKEVGRRRPEPAEVSTKADPADWVSVVDVSLERRAREVLAEEFPLHGVVGEEFGGEEPPGGGPRWYLDPIDGTTNFVHGLPGYSFSLAVADEAGLAAGVVAVPFTGELFSAVRGQGAWLGHQQLACTQATTLVGGIVLVELAGYRIWPGLGELMARLEQRACVVRVLGSSALTLASVGAGRAAAACFGACHPIDCAAGALVAKEAGAHVVAGRDTQRALGGDIRAARAGLAVAAPGVVGEILQIWDG